MTRYTKTNTKTRNFIGWDNAMYGDRACEASKSAHIHTPLSMEDAAIFGELAPDEVVTRGGFTYERHD